MVALTGELKPIGVGLTVTVEVNVLPKHPKEDTGVTVYFTVPLAVSTLSVNV